MPLSEGTERCGACREETPVEDLRFNGLLYLCIRCRPSYVWRIPEPE